MENMSHLSEGDTPRPELSEPQEDYLKQIFLLGGDGKRVSTQALATRLRVQPASVTEMVARLDQLGLVDRAPYRGVQLTSAGRRVALEMLRHHRLLEAFLVDVLGYEWDQVHDEAERLEHVISERFEERIAAAMGHPTHDPHGDPIPGSDLSLPVAETGVVLTALPVGTTSRIVRVATQHRDTLNLLGRLGLGPGCTVKVTSVERRGVRIQIDGKGLLLPNDIAELLWMEGDTE